MFVTGKPSNSLGTPKRQSTPLLCETRGWKCGEDPQAGEQETKRTRSPSSERHRRDGFEQGPTTRTWLVGILHPLQAGQLSTGLGCLTDRLPEGNSIVTIVGCSFSYGSGSSSSTSVSRQRGTSARRRERDAGQGTVAGCKTTREASYGRAFASAWPRRCG